MLPSGISEQQFYYLLLVMQLELEHKVFFRSETDADILKRMPLTVQVIAQQTFPEPAEIIWKNSYHNGAIFSPTMLFHL